MFGVPTALLAYIYYDMGINNLWQLFLFGWAAVLGYMPGIIMLNWYINDVMKKAVQKSLTDFADSRTYTDNRR